MIAMNMFRKMIETTSMNEEKKRVEKELPHPVGVLSESMHWKRIERFLPASCIRLFQDSPVVHRNSVSIAIPKFWKLAWWSRFSYSLTVANIETPTTE
jgi:hypothetical protein